MDVNDTTPREDYTIAGKTFSIPQPYTEGHTLTAGEASQLNQVLAENIRNNLAGRVKELVDGGTFDQDDAQLMVDTYFEEYEMGVRSGGGGRVVDPVRKEAMVITANLVKDAIKRKHGGLKGVKVKDINAKAASIIDNKDHPRHREIWDTAHQRVAAQRDLADLELDAA